MTFTIKLKRPFFILASLGLLFVMQSCKKPIKYIKTKSGLEYFYFEKLDTGKQGKPGYYYLVDMIGQREDDSIFINSYSLGQKIKFVRTLPPFHSLFNDALGMLRNGDSLIFRMPADSFFRPLGQPTPKYLKPNENIRFTLKVKDILHPDEHLVKMYLYEFDRMVDYIQQKKWQCQTDTTTGIKYEILKKGNGMIAELGDKVDVAITLTYLNHKIIDRTKPGDKMTVIVGSDAYISGLNRLIQLSDEGSTLRALIPFAEGFGEEGGTYVEPYATLVMNLEIFKINRK
jgi:hypothetical protein